MSYQASILSRTLPISTFNRLKSALQQTVQEVEENAFILTENIICSKETLALQQLQQFIVVVSEQFSALLLGYPSTSDDLELVNSSSDRHNLQSFISIQAGLTFEPEAIAAFLKDLEGCLNCDVLSGLESARQMLKPNDAKIQSQFTLLLLEIIVDNNGKNTTPQLANPHIYIKENDDNTLQKNEQDQILNQVTMQISRSLQLPVILTTVIEQVCDLLQLDRLVIYEFEDLVVSGKSSPLKIGRITYEARASAAISSVLHLTEEDQCFLSQSDCWEKYRNKFALITEDVQNVQTFSPCLLKFMEKVQVRAKLVVPIVVQEELWGLLIAHQCFEPRKWQEREKTFLQHIAEHLAIAIYQAQLYKQLQQEKNTLEQRVIERTQALLEALLAAQAADQAKSEFLATISHELRTPLTSIIGLSSTLLHWSSAVGDTLPGKKKVEIPIQNQQKYLKTIHDSGKHLLELIDNIIDLSQLEAGKAFLNISAFSLKNLAKQTLQIVEEKAQLKGVKLAVDLQLQQDKEKKQTVDLISVNFNAKRFIADEERLKQILLNLLNNAIKFTPSGGTVTFRVWREKEAAVFQVEDTGIGISKHQQLLIFEKFQQLEQPYRRNYEGIGLGLALTKHLVELHGGRIEVDSVVGLGSTFTVWLPPQKLVSADKKQTTNGTISSPTPLGSIVIVEHYEEVATPICNILTAAGYQVVWLIEGSTAFERIELLQPKAVIVDMRSPGINGYEFVNTLRNSQATQHIKIMVLAELEIAEEQQHNIYALTDDYLLNPSQPEQLLHKIAAIMAG